MFFVDEASREETATSLKATEFYVHSKIPFVIWNF